MDQKNGDFSNSAADARYSPMFSEQYFLGQTDKLGGARIDAQGYVHLPVTTTFPGMPEFPKG